MVSSQCHQLLSCLSVLRSAGKKKEGPYRYENIVPPAHVDWREKEIVGPIKNQHVGGSPCGCCWAFATIGVTECIVALATGKPISLSEQQLIDCDKGGACIFSCTVNQHRFKHLQIVAADASRRLHL